MKSKHNILFLNCPINGRVTALPSDVPYDILADLYLPEEDPNLIQFYNTEFDHCITLLIDEALKRTGNYDTSNYYGGMTSGGDLVSLKLPTKWTPAGNIKRTDRKSVV